MHHRRITGVFSHRLLLLGALMAAALPAADAATLVIRGGTLFDPVAGVMRPVGAIVVEGDRIQAVTAPGEPVASSAGATVIDATGKFLLPGLIDGHAHVAHVLNVAGLKGTDTLPLYLANGITTLRDVGDRLEPQQELAAAIAARPERYPRLYLGSPLLDGLPPYHTGPSIPLTSADEVPPLVAELAAADVRTFKIYVGLDRAIGSAIIREVHRHGRRVTAHLRRYPPLEAIADGIDSLEHIESVFDFVTPPEVPVWPLRNERTHLTPAAVAALRRRILEEQIKTDYASPRAVELIQALARRQVMVNPTLVVYKNWMLLTDPDEAMRDPDVVRMPARLQRLWSSTVAGAGASPGIADLRRKQLAKLQELTGVLYRAGVPLLVGTDAPVNFCPPGFALHQELELLVGAGLPPAAALTAATRNNARALDQWSQLGSIEPGKFADLVILDANPLADIRNTRRISRVIRGGIVCDPTKLFDLVPGE